MQNLLKQQTIASSIEDRLPVTIAAHTRRVYDRLASFYHFSTMFFHSKAHRCALEQSGVRDGMRVLEVATGSGEMFHRLVKANPKGATLGLDLSPNMAARTQHRASKRFPDSFARCQAVDARYLPFRDETFDAVISCYLLELLSQEDITRTLSEIRRVLRPHATVTLVLIGQNTEVFNRLYDLAGSLVPAFWGRQIEEKMTDFLEEQDLRILHDCVVRQTFYPSRILTARK